MKFFFKKESEIEPLIDRFNIPGGFLGKNSYITINAIKEVEVNGCKNLLVYEDHMIKLCLCDCVLTIYGTCLTLKTYFGNQMIVAGNICKLEFEKLRNKNGQQETPTKEAGDK